MLASVTINAFKPAETPYKKSDGGGLFCWYNQMVRRFGASPIDLKANRSSSAAATIPRPLCLLHGVGERK